MKTIQIENENKFDFLEVNLTDYFLRFYVNT